MSKTLIIDRELAGKLLTLEDCIPAMRETLVAAAQGRINQLQRMSIPAENGNGLAIMPAAMLDQQVSGAKIIIFKTHQGIVPLFDTETGMLRAITDGEVMTVIRTASTSAAATDALARRDASTVAILGAGRQGRAHARAMALIRDIKKVYIWDMFPAAVESAVKELSESLPGVELVPCATPEMAVRDADIICTVTSTRGDDPFLKGEWLKEGAHINAVGAIGDSSREIETSAVQRARVFMDWEEASLRDGGDIVIPLKKGEITRDHILGEVGSVITGKIEGRTSDRDITMFETVGLSVQDVSAANIMYKKAVEQGLGVWVELC